MKKNGKLTLIPTPIDNQSKLNIEAFDLLLAAAKDSENNIFLVEDPKPARRRWIYFGLPRETIESFVYFNEQTSKDLISEVIQGVKKGKNAYLMSDAGLPAFCDPGVNLINRCHEEKIQVTSTPFFNSVALALALSGFSHHQFVFHGFVARKSGEREKFLGKALKNRQTGILMDTPYRLKNLLETILTCENQVSEKREYCLALDLGKSSEKVLRGTVKNIMKNVPFETKPEFILIIKEVCP